MTREEQSALVAELLATLAERDGKFAAPHQCLASWAAELTDLIGWPVIVTFIPGAGVVAYAVPTPRGRPFMFEEGDIDLAGADD